MLQMPLPGRTTSTLVLPALKSLPCLRAHLTDFACQHWQLDGMSVSREEPTRDIRGRYCMLQDVLLCVLTPDCQRWGAYIMNRQDCQLDIRHRLVLTTYLVSNGCIICSVGEVVSHWCTTLRHHSQGFDYAYRA